MCKLHDGIKYKVLSTNAVRMLMSGTDWIICNFYF